MHLLLASITGPLVDFGTTVIKDLGLAGVAVMMATSGVIGLPGTEPTLLFAGFDVYKGSQSLVGVIIAGVVGDMLGASIAYAIGYWGRIELIERHGNKLHVSAARLQRAHGWFERYGSPAIFVSRFLPGIRAVFPYAAGVAEMPFARFFGFAALGSIGWVAGLSVLGREVGQNWTSWKRHLEYADYALIALVVLAVAYLILRRIRSGGSGSTPAVDAVSD